MGAKIGGRIKSWWKYLWKRNRLSGERHYAWLNYELVEVAHTRIALGSQVSVFNTEEKLNSLYGKNSMALKVFLRIFPGLMKWSSSHFSKVEAFSCCRKNHQLAYGILFCSGFGQMRITARLPFIIDSSYSKSTNKELSSLKQPVSKSNSNCIKTEHFILPCFIKYWYTIAKLVACIFRPRMKSVCIDKSTIVLMWKCENEMHYNVMDTRKELEKKNLKNLLVYQA